MISDVHGKKVSISSGSLLDPLSIQHPACAGEQGAELLALHREEVLPLLSTLLQPPAVIPPPVEKDRTSHAGLRRTRRAK
jgi:hypothetical protein